MATHPAIYTIQASDAPQHTGKLQKILQNLKTENRIEGFTTLASDEDLSSVTDEVKDEDLILIVLTHELESQKKQIEHHVKEVKANQPNIRVAEILVDNVVYDNEFLTFPVDLRPVRDREDMDAAWNSIELNLKELFQVHEKEGTIPPFDWSKYLKIAAVAVGFLLVFIIIRGAINGGDKEGITVDWLRAADEAFFIPAEGISIDAAGNSYAIGRYTGSNEVIGGNSLPSGSPQRVVMTKYDPDGNLVWVNTFGGTGSTSGTGIAANPDGSFCISAYFDNTVTVGPGYTFSSPVSRDILTAKYDADGTLLWAAAAIGPSSNFTQDVAIDAMGNCIVTGHFQDDVSFGNTSVSGSGMFIAKYSGEGDPDWVATSEEGSAQGHGVDVDADSNIYVAGNVRVGTSFSGTSVLFPSGVGHLNIFVAKYDPNGGVAWVRAAGGASQDEAFAIAVDDAGNSHITGWYRSDATFGDHVVSAPRTGGNIFVSRLDPHGNFTWAIGGSSSSTSSNSGSSIAVDPTGTIYVSGEFTNNLTLGGSTLRRSGSNAYLARLSPGGELETALLGAGGYLAVDGFGGLWIAGSFRDTLEIGDKSITSTSSAHFYVSRLRTGIP